MINKKDNPIAWAQLMCELEDAHEHLGQLILEMNRDAKTEIESYTIDLGHIYAHLNRAWNTREITGEVSEKQWESGRAFPQDLEPIA